MSLRLHVATRKGLMSWRKDSGKWAAQSVHFLGDCVTQLLPDERDRSLYSVLTLGHFGAKLRRLPEGATEWIECGVPVYPDGSEVNDGHPGEDGSVKKKPASLKEIWALESGGDDRPGVLWAGTIPGGLFRSDDHGATWSIVDSLWNRPERAQWFGGGKDDPGIHSVCVDPTNSKRVAIGISCGGAWFSNDGGETWTVGQGMRAEYMPPNLAYEPSAQDPHRMVLCPSKPDRMWVQHHNGVFRSDDFAANWTEITDVPPAPFGFAVVVHPKNPDHAWLVPAVKDEKRVPVDSRVVVSRTRDGGKTFDVLSAGLPEPPSYDLVYRHALDIAGDGNTLAFGSTTGGLWISENGGDSWTCLTHTLPPIYAVRFSSFETTADDSQQLQVTAEKAARIGGAILQEWAGRITPKEKSPKNLVTEADFASQKAISEFLTRECPGHDFLGEEDCGPAAITSDYRWIVDPLDGTSNYVHRFPFYAVSIGVEHKGELVAGAIFDPTRNEMFAAASGGGATLNGQTIEPSATGPLASALVIASLPVKTSPESPEVRRFLRVLTKAQSLQRTGSAALNLCYVAAGRMDAFWSTSLKPWDMAAGVLILREAGGRVTAINGGPFDVDVSDLLASNGNALHDELAELLPRHD